MPTKPEYLTIFPLDGLMTVCVNFKDFTGSIADRRLDPEDFSKLIDPERGGFYRSMYFDSYSFDISNYAVDPVKNTLTIHARPSIHFQPNDTD